MRRETHEHARPRRDKWREKAGPELAVPKQIKQLLATKEIDAEPGEFGLRGRGQMIEREGGKIGLGEVAQPMSGGVCVPIPGGKWASICKRVRPSSIKCRLAASESRRVASSKRGFVMTF